MAGRGPNHGREWQRCGPKSDPGRLLSATWQPCLDTAALACCYNSALHPAAALWCSKARHEERQLDQAHTFGEQQGHPEPQNCLIPKPQRALPSIPRPFSLAAREADPWDSAAQNKPGGGHTARPGQGPRALGISARPSPILRAPARPAPGLQWDVAVEQPVVLGVGLLLRATGGGLSRQRVVRGRRAGVAPRSEVAPVQGANGGRVVLVGRVGVRERRRRCPESRVVLQAAWVI